MVRPFDAAWSIIKQYDVNSYRGKTTLGREGRQALRDDAMAGANAFHQARIDAMQNLPDPRVQQQGGRFTPPPGARGAPFNPFIEGGAEQLRAALRAQNSTAPPPVSTVSPTGMTMPLSAGKPREQRRGGARGPASPRPGFRTREPMPLDDRSAERRMEQ